MSADEVWDDAAREKLREALRMDIWGELRLGRYDHEEIVESSRLNYDEECCPAEEREDFLQFMADEVERLAVRLESEKRSWPDQTDCDRLDRVEAALRERGILLWQASPCCDTCTGAELPDRADEIEQRYPGFRDRLRGYAFFIEQNLPEMLADDTQISVYLAYGWVPADPEAAENENYEQQALAIAREVCGCLREEGFEPDWDGDLSRKIGITLNWQRRTLLE